MRKLDCASFFLSFSSRAALYGVDALIVKTDLPRYQLSFDEIPNTYESRLAYPNPTPTS